MSRELELKLVGSSRVLKRVAKSAALTRLRVGEPVHETLTTAYYDTPDGVLARAGIAVRVRHNAEGGYIQSVKRSDNGGNGRKGLAMDREEIEFPLSHGEPNLEPLPSSLRKEIETALNGKPLGLVPLFETKIERTRQIIATRTGDRIELALDLGAVKSDKGETPVAELELELKDGSPRAIYDVAAPLVDAHDLRLGRGSKASLGFALVGVEMPESEAKKVEVAKPETCGELWQETHTAVVETLLAQEEAFRASFDPDAVHQFRVALRRYRARLKIARAFAESDLTKRLGAEARDLARVMGHVRDIDVFQSDTLPLVAEHGGKHSAKLLATIVAEELARRRKTAIAELGARRYAGFLLMAAAEAVEPQLDPDVIDAPLIDVARKVLKKRFKKVRALGKDFAGLDAEARHEVRKKLKELRYAVETFSHLFEPKAVKSFVSDMKELQDQLGLMNDAAVGRGLAGELFGGLAEGDAGLAHAKGWLEGYLTARHQAALRDAVPAWEDFAETEPFWA